MAWANEPEMLNAIALVIVNTIGPNPKQDKTFDDFLEQKEQLAVQETNKRKEESILLQSKLIQLRRLMKEDFIQTAVASSLKEDEKPQ